MSNSLPSTSVPAGNSPSGSGIINNPGITQEGVITRRAVKDAAQALMVAQALDNDGLERDKKAALVEDEYNGTAPFDAKKLKANKQDFRFNISTQFMMSLIDRRTPSLVRAVESASYLTNSALPDDTQNGVSKTLKFRKRLTRVIRAWSGWREFLNKSACENVRQGYCAATWPSRYDWRVVCAKQTEFRVPDGTSLKSEECQAFTWRSWWQPSRLLDRLLNPEAEEAGWNIANGVKAINEAQPKQKASGAETSGKAMKDMADLQREGSLALNYQNGEIGVACWDCKFQEVGGRVTQYIIRQNDGLELFKSEDAYDSMGYCVQFISIEEGNSILYGARGVGRKLFNIAKATEKSRNIFLDFVGLSGYLWFQKDPNKVGPTKSRDAQVQVAAPLVIINMDGTPITNASQVNIEAFVTANNMLTGLAENVAGTILPTQNMMPAINDKTATEAKIDAGREEELKASVLERWVLQISDVVSIIQRRLCDPDSPDEVSKQFRKELMEIDELTEEDIIAISTQPAAQSIYSSSTVLRAQLAEVAQKWGQTGAIDLRKLARLDIHAALDESVAKEILTDELNDEQILEKGRRDQLIEYTAMLAGFQVPIEITDSHQGHLEGAINLIVGPKMELLTPETIDIEMAKSIALLFDHCSEHVAALKEQGAPPDLVQKYGQLLQQGEAMLQQVIAKRSEMEKALAAVAGSVQTQPQEAVPVA